MANVSGAAYAAQPSYDVLGTATEFKFSRADETGEFEGYGAVFGNIDSHGDVITPGAFKASLDRHKAAGSTPGMYFEHGPALGREARPIGIWTEMAEDEKGLRVKGRLIGLDTDFGRYNYAMLREGALRGLSIGYKAKRDQVAYGRNAGDPKRTLKGVDLLEVSLVRDPSNPLAQVDRHKSAIQDALDDGRLPTLREFKNWIREAAARDGLHVSRSDAEHIAAFGFKSLLTERDAGGAGDNGLKDAIAGVRGLFR